MRLNTLRLVCIFLCYNLHLDFSKLNIELFYIFCLVANDAPYFWLVLTCLTCLTCWTLSCVSLTVMFESPPLPLGLAYVWIASYIS